MKQAKINKKLFSIMIDALKKLRDIQDTKNLPLQEIRMHLVDEVGDGVGVWVEYDKETGEFSKGMLPLDMEHVESAAEEYFREKSFDEMDEMQSEVIKAKGLLN